MQAILRIKIELDLKALGVDGVSDLDHMLASGIEDCVTALEKDGGAKVLSGEATHGEVVGDGINTYTQYYPDELDRSEACENAECINTAAWGYTIGDSEEGQVCDNCRIYISARAVFYPI